MQTSGDIWDQINDFVRDAETRALFGERMTALCLIRQAGNLYDEYKQILTPFGDTKTMAARIATIAGQLCAEFDGVE